MQTLSSNMITALVPRVAATDAISRNRTLLWEVYAADYFPSGSGFDPADAIVLWGSSEVTWQGHDYQRRIVSHSAIEQFIDGKFNNVTLTIENADRYLSAFIVSSNVNGMRLVARYINIDLSTALGDSVVCFVGRLEAPTGDLDREQGDLTAKEELASLDIEIPRRTVTPEDPEGRSPNDPLFQGFLFNARPSSVKFVETETSRKFLIFLKKKDIVKYNQWSSVSETDGAVVPLVGGRVQRQGLPVFWTDIGFYIIGIWVYSGHKVTSITNFQLPDPNYVFYGPWATEVHKQLHVHLGDPGGTGTNATADTIDNTYPQNTALLSDTGYAAFAIGGPESATQPFANPNMDSVPTLVAIVCGECDLPDGSGDFTLKGFSDSPVYLARQVLTDPNFFGLDTRLVYDGELPAIHAERQRPIIDRSNGEFLALMSQDATALLDGRLTRLNSTGLIDSRYFRHIVDPAYPDPLVTNREDVYGVAPGGDAASGGDQQFTNGVGISGQSVASSAWKYYYIDTPVGAAQLQITATGSGDGTSFIKLGSKPTLTDYDAFAYTASPQIMTIANPTAGRWWIGIAGFQPDGTPAAGLSYSIIAIYSGGAVGQVLPIRTAIRKAYTLNVPLTDTSNAIDFLNNVVLPSARLYRLTDSLGRQRIRAKKASDSSYLTANASIAATSVSVANVEPWRASVRGYLLIDVGETTSETRKITSAVYNATVGNAVTLAVSGTGLAASGATLSGGSTTVPASGTVAVNSLAAVDTVLTVTVLGIPITYTVTANDDVNSIAGMLSVSINADPNLRQYVRATWDGAHTVTIYCTIGTLGFATGLVSAHVAQVASPLVAPTATTTTSGTLVPGIYYLGYTLVDGSGNETLISPLKQITIASGQKVSVSSPGTLPTGATGANWYFSPAHDDDHVQFLLNNAGGSFTINTVPDPDSDYPPTMNTTGCETIRVMEVFNELNIRKDTFKWSPSTSQTNQVTGTFIDAANGFKPQPVTVNDILHQRAVRKINKLEINLSGVDNFSQASRLCYAALAEQRDAGERWKWATDDAGIPLEIGDVVCVNGNYVDPSGTVQKEFVNVPVMLESTSLAEDFDVSFVGVFYSTSLLEGQTGRKPVVIPTTLKYFTEAPPVASNVVITLDDNFLTGFIGDFDFGSTAGIQRGLIFIKGPQDTEPDDSTYKLLDVVLPDLLNKGHFELRAAVGGNYWIKIVTQSQFGQSAASGHPVNEIKIRPAIMTDQDITLDASSDWLITALGHPRLIEQPAIFICEIWDGTGRTDPATHMKRTLQMVTGTTQAAILSADHTTWTEGVVNTTSWANKNNLYGHPYFGATIQKIEQPFQRFDFTMRARIANGSTPDFGTGTFRVSLQHLLDSSLGTGVSTVDFTTSPLSIEWTYDGADINGMVVETVRSFSTVLKTTHNVDPGYGGTTIVSNEVVESGRQGPRYTFLVNGNEFAVYRDFKPAGGNVPIAKVTVNPINYPLRLIGNMTSSSGDDFEVSRIMFGGSMFPSTIYARREQVQDFGSPQTTLHLRLYQASGNSLIPNGEPLDITVP